MKLFINNSPVEINKFTFPGGEEHLKLGYRDWSNYEIDVSVRDCRNASDILTLMMVIDVLRDNSGPRASIHLELCHLPFARQDRRTSRDEPFSLRIIAEMLNSMMLESITFWDAHSEISEVLVDESKSLPQGMFLHNVVGALTQDLGRTNIVVVSPDAGAHKKTFDACSSCGLSDIAKFVKNRDTATGKLSGCHGMWDTKWDAMDIVILDDICDGGGTFLMIEDWIRKNTKNSNPIYLATTHGIYSKGTDILLDKFDRLFCSHSLTFTPDDRSGKGSPWILDYTEREY
jgi:ribose-phosphate pyrophosphokinase